MIAVSPLFIALHGRGVPCWPAGWFSSGRLAGLSRPTALIWDLVDVPRNPDHEGKESQQHIQDSETESDPTEPALFVPENPRHDTRYRGDGYDRWEPVEQKAKFRSAPVRMADHWASSSEHEQDEGDRTRQSESEAAKGEVPVFSPRPDTRQVIRLIRCTCTTGARHLSPDDDQDLRLSLGGQSASGALAPALPKVVPHKEPHTPLWGRPQSRSPGSRTGHTCTQPLTAHILS